MVSSRTCSKCSGALYMKDCVLREVCYSLYNGQRHRLGSIGEVGGLQLTGIGAPHLCYLVIWSYFDQSKPSCSMGSERRLGRWMRSRGLGQQPPSRMLRRMRRAFPRWMVAVPGTSRPTTEVVFSSTEKSPFWRRKTA